MPTRWVFLLGLVWWTRLQKTRSDELEKPYTENCTQIPLRGHKLKPERAIIFVASLEVRGEKMTQNPIRGDMKNT